MEQAEKIEQEFVSLMTGQMHGNTPEKRGLEDRNDRRKFASPSKLALVRKFCTYQLAAYNYFT